MEIYIQLIGLWKKDNVLIQTQYQLKKLKHTKDTMKHENHEKYKKNMLNKSMVRNMSMLKKNILICVSNVIVIM